MNWLKKLWRKLTKGKPKRLVLEDEWAEMRDERIRLAPVSTPRTRVLLFKSGKRTCEKCFYFCNGRCHLNGKCIPAEKIPVPSQIVLAADRVRHEQLHREMERPEDRLRFMTAEEHIELHRRRGLP